jgi:hypothetical protein
VIRISILPDNVLLEVFYFYLNRSETEIEGWQPLVHVCRQWRSLVFASPRRLNLQLHCTPKTPARDILDIWPALPLVVEGNIAYSETTDNVIAALEQSNRVCHVRLDLAGSQLEKVLASMQAPFPELTYLALFSRDETLSALPDSFLDGSAPRLRHFELDGIPFPGLPKTLLSATHLVNLSLFSVAHSGYFSPEAIVTPLAVLSSLRTFVLHFQTVESRPDRETRCPPPSKRSALPALTMFHFQGVYEYLEDLVTFIDAPRLNEFYVTFLDQINFHTPRLGQFISRTPRFTARDKARVQIIDGCARVALAGSGTLEIEILYGDPNSQVLRIAGICSSLPPVSTVEVLYIEYQTIMWKNVAIEDTLWLDLLLPFSAVKNLHLSREIEIGITAALQENYESELTEVLPNLQNIF